MSLGVFRELTEADKARRPRLGKGRPVNLPAPPPLPKMTPKAAAESVEAGILGSMLKDRESFAQLVQMMRTTHGSKVSWMSDAQILELARQTYREKVRESTTRAFMRKRARELTINIGGI